MSQTPRKSRVLQRVVAGGASAFLFIAGGLLAARLGALQPARSGLLLGLYYGGTGFGIVLSALLVPAALEAIASRGQRGVLGPGSPLSRG